MQKEKTEKSGRGLTKNHANKKSSPDQDTRPALRIAKCCFTCSKFKYLTSNISRGICILGVSNKKFEELKKSNSTPKLKYEMFMPAHMANICDMWSRKSPKHTFDALTVISNWSGSSKEINEDF